MLLFDERVFLLGGHRGLLLLRARPAIEDDGRRECEHEAEECEDAPRQVAVEEQEQEKCDDGADVDEHDESFPRKKHDMAIIS